MRMRILLLSVAIIYTTHCSPFNKPPQIINKVKPEILLQYGPIHRLTLECEADGLPVPRTQWFRNNEVVTDYPGLTLQDTSLVFQVPGPEHLGYYHCEASNILGRAVSSTVHLTTVLSNHSQAVSPPYFIAAPENEIAREGSTVELLCEVGGVPTPSIVWTKNGDEIAGETGTKLVVTSLAESDVANYACNASNPGGYVYKNVYLTMLAMVAHIVQGPRKHNTASRGQNVSLTCQAEGYPKPVISWSVNGSEIFEEDDDKYIIDKMTGDLHVVSVDNSDEGVYRCTARNHGEDSVSGSLTVTSVPTIVDGPSDRQVVIFSSIMIPCTVLPSLHITVSWKKNNIDLGREGFEDNDRISVDSDNALHIKNLSFTDSGKECPTNHPSNNNIPS